MSEAEIENTSTGPSLSLSSGLIVYYDLLMVMVNISSTNIIEDRIE